MREFISLKIVDRFRRPLERMGCDYPLLRKILEVKLTMDARRVPTIMMRNGRRRKNVGQEDDKNAFIRSLWLYAFMGLVTVPFVLMSQNYLFQMSTVFAILMFLVMTSMISDFSSVLLDIRDRMIISTKPVPGRTISFARTIHITIYLCLLTAALTGPALIASLIRHGVLFFLVFLLTIILLDILVMVITALVYLLILNVFDGERLKDIINYVQIVLSVAILVGYQLVGRSFAVFQMHIVFQAAWWQVFVPPFWFGAAFSWFQGHGATPEVIALTLLAVVVPLLLFAVYIRLMPAFERKLQKLSSEDSQTKSSRRSFSALASRILCRSNEEQAFFRFGTVMMAREREFKLKVYPSLGFSMVLPFIMILNPAFSQGLHSLTNSKWYLSIYFIAIIVPTVMTMLRYSGKYKAAWIYRSTPIASAVAVYRGTIKAFLVRLLLPVFVVESVIFVFVFGSSSIVPLLAAGLSMLIYTVICFLLLDKDFPFSQPFQVVQQKKRYMTFVLLLITFVFVLVQFCFTLIPYGIYVYFVLLVGLNIVLWRYGFRLKQH